MYNEYRIAARRHRWLLLIPIVVAPAIALWMVLGTPSEYQSTTSLWFDTPPPADSSVTNPDASLTPPAAQAQIVLGELLQTKQFRALVGARSGLAAYLATSAPAGWSPTALLKQLKSAPTVDARLSSALGPAHVTSHVDGPQVLTIGVEQEAPGIARATLQGLLDEFRQENTSLNATRMAAAAAYYRDQVTAAKQADDAVKAQIGTYLRTHPGSTLVDPSLAILTQAEQAAAAKLVDASNSLNAATIGGASGQDSMRIIDPPAEPLGPVRGMKAMAMGVAAGLFGGLMVAVAGLVGLVALGRMRARAPVAPQSDGELVRLLKSPYGDFSSVVDDATPGGGAGAAAEQT
jgi:hypothetical protein